ncbi:MAG: AcrR family transcriptional regulator [Porticoccaceae bacterium]|jgi:AcrR family transcriptional regulator
MRRKARQVRSIETTNAILIAAAQVLEDQGYARATTDRIAARAGVSIGSVYQYFDNKLELFERMFDRECDLIVSGLQNYSIDENAAPYENLQRLLGISKGHITPGQFRELSRIPELKGKIAYVSEVIICTIADFVGHFQPDLRDDERRIKADLIVTTAQSLGFRARDKKHHAKLLDEFYRMINRYIVSEP